MYEYDRAPSPPVFIETPPSEPVEKQAADDVEDADVDLEFGELQVAEYIVFLLALDTYMRYLDEASEEPGFHIDDMSTKGLRLLRSADRLHLDSIGAFLREHLPSDTHKKMLEKALRMRPTSEGTARRALHLRTLLSRGGAPTMRAVFQTNKALQHVRQAISAAMMEDADAALDKFAVIQVRNTKIRDWIDDAAKFAGSGTPPTPMTAAASSGMTDGAKKLVEAKMEQEGSDATSEGANKALAEQDSILSRVKQEAEEAAKKSIEASGEEDAPPKKSEVMGLAAAAAVAAVSDPGDLRNVPESLKKLDPEQRAAALTDGKVLVAAGAGAGKSTTLVARIRYLVQEKGANPARILACSFNRKAADELKEKVAKSIGPNSALVDTMHVIFFKFIVGDKQRPGFGTQDEQAMLTPPRLIAQPKKGSKGAKPISPASLTAAIRGMWADCDPIKLAAMVEIGRAHV